MSDILIGDILSPETMELERLASMLSKELSPDDEARKWLLQLCVSNRELSLPPKLIVVRAELANVHKD